MSTSLLFGRKAGRIGELQLDAVISENHQYEAEVSQFPIEAGSLISDHVRITPERISIDGFVTNSPIITVIDRIKSILIKKPGESEAKESFRDGSESRVEIAQDILLRMQGRQIDGEDLEPQLVDVVTGLRVYTDMVMSTLTIPRSSQTGQAIKFTAQFVKIAKVKSESITIPNPQIEFKDTTQSKVDKGKQTPVETTPEQTKSVSSIKKAYNTVSRAFGN